MTPLSFPLLADENAPAFGLASLAALEVSARDVVPPFIAVVERKGTQARIRIRGGG